MALTIRKDNSGAYWPWDAVGDDGFSVAMFKEKSDAQRFIASADLLASVKELLVSARSVELGAYDRAIAAVAKAEPKPTTPDELVGIIRDLRKAIDGGMPNAVREEWAPELARADAAINAAKGGAA